MTTLRMSEVFGPTIQGEGPSTGRRAVFVRVSGCNFDCSWCDTPYTWDWTGKNGTAYDPKVEMARVPVDELAADVLDRLAGLPGIVVFTGGEPMLQQRGLAALARRLTAEGVNRIEVETNGSQSPYLLNAPDVWFNVSPKLANSGVTHPIASHHIEPFVDLAHAHRAVFKFVCARPGDLDEVAEIVDRYGIPARTVWIMPEGRNRDRLDATAVELVDQVLAHGWNLTSRLHVHMWGDRRGR